MKYLLILVLIGLASVEYFHHVADGHGAGAPVCMGPQGKQQEARDTLLQHLRSHR